MPQVDLTPFGFTPTESLVYEVLLSSGPGTGYAIARSAGLARANAYSALEGLVSKGAARVEAGRPRRYRPEPPAALIARIATDHGQAMDRLSRELESFAGASGTQTLVEVESGRAVLQLLLQEIARATRALELLIPPDAYPLVAHALRRPVSAGLAVDLCSTGPVELEFAPVEVVAGDGRAWPGMPIIAIADGESALVASRQGSEVRGHWSTSPSFVAAARLAYQGFRGR